MDSISVSGLYLHDAHYLVRARTNSDLAVMLICLCGMNIWNDPEILNLATG